MDILTKYFPDLTPLQAARFEALEPLYRDWNQKINVISRQDIGALYEKHILHSLAIARVISFQPGARILDVGTGGGFPGIPLAILFEETEFHLIDSIGKKIGVVNDICRQLELRNVTATHIRAEQVKDTYDFIVSRAVTRLKDFTLWTTGRIDKVQRYPIPNGILYLKGGDLEEELGEVRLKARIYPVSDYFDEPFFETKKVVHLWK